MTGTHGEFNFTRFYIAASRLLHIIIDLYTAAIQGVPIINVFPDVEFS